MNKLYKLGTIEKLKQLTKFEQLKHWQVGKRSIEGVDKLWKFDNPTKRTSLNMQTLEKLKSESWTNWISWNIMRSRHNLYWRPVHRFREEVYSCLGFCVSLCHNHVGFMWILKLLLGIAGLCSPPPISWSGDCKMERGMYGGVGGRDRDTQWTLLSLSFLLGKATPGYVF